MERLVKVESVGSTAILTMMNPPVNALSRSLAEALREAWAQTDAERVILTGSGKMFVAGADIREIEKITKREILPELGYLNELLNLIERGGKQVVMAMNGGALGIGLELAMAGHYRILKAGASVGLPEVKLGLIPGAGGTQRLPRLAGVEAALRMCVSGEVVGAEAALQLGIVDELCDGDVVERALAVTQGRRTDLLLCAGDVDWDKWSASGKKGQRAPERAVAAIQAAVQSASFDAGLAVEERLFCEALLDEQARAMVHLFFAERELGKAAFLPKGVVAAEVESATDVGDDLIELHAGGVCQLKVSPAEFGANVVEVKWEQGMQPELLAAALGYVKRLGKLAVICVGGEGWLGKPGLDAMDGKRLVAQGMALRAGDLDVLMVRGYGYPEELGGPMHAAAKE